MIMLRRAEERHHVRRGKHEVWLTFHASDLEDPLADGFGTLQSLSEDMIPPGAAVPLLSHCDSDIVTYVHEGALAHRDGNGCSGIIYAGEFERMTPGHGASRRETNASRTQWAHVFQMRLGPSQADRVASHEHRRFCAAERRGLLRVIASRDGREGSLRIHDNARIYSALLDPGQHLVHELLPHRSAWLHMVHGVGALGDVMLATGDGAGLTEVRAVSLTALEETEILLVDLGEPFASPLLMKESNDQSTPPRFGGATHSASRHRRDHRSRDVAEREP